MPESINIAQNTDDFFLFRKSGLGASDMPIVLGLSPWKTPYQLWLEKTGIESAPYTETFATERGKALEDIARQHYLVDSGIDTYPKIFKSDEHHFLFASLDGYSVHHKLVLEIKCPLNKEDHELAAQGKIPEKYAYQVQQQLYCSGAKLAHYYSFDGVTGHTVYVHRNEQMIEKLIGEGSRFWKMIQEREAPELTDKDYKRVDDTETKKLVTLYREAKANKESAETLLEELKKQLTANLPWPRIDCMGLRIAKTYRKGNVDYKKIPELTGVNLEPYRGPMSKFYTVSEKR